MPFSKQLNTFDGIYQKTVVVVFAYDFVYLCFQFEHLSFEPLGVEGLCIVSTSDLSLQLTEFGIAVANLPAAVGNIKIEILNLNGLLLRSFPYRIASLQVFSSLRRSKATAKFVS